MSSCRGTGNHSPLPRTKPPPDYCGADRPVTMQVTQEGAQHPAHRFAAVGGPIECMPLDIANDGLGGERRELLVCTGGTNLPQKPMREEPVTFHRRGSQSSFA